ncbi:MAG: hypothetical protein GEV08_02130 [Acidimicrobiia bacterium]|nr:hypothetical protein [Acidimicrobiia bacterium]
MTEPTAARAPAPAAASLDGERAVEGPGAPTEVTPGDLVARAHALGPLVEASRAQMDAERRLPAIVVEALQHLGALRAAVPRQLGGPELGPAAQVELVEELSRLDGSVGWCAMIAAAGSYVSGFLDPVTAERWFGPADACLAGQLAPTGRADRVQGGYRVSGRFAFASGSGHATMMIAGCLVFEGGELSRHPSGRPQLRSVIVPVSACTILDTWHTTGLWGTGSNDYVLDDVFVAEQDGWDPAGPLYRSEALYRYPPLFLVPHAGVPLGIARSAIDTVIVLAEEKQVYARGARSGTGRTLGDEDRTHEAVARAEAVLGAARAFTYRTIAELWEVIERGDRVPQRLRGTYRIMLTYAHEAAKDVISVMYDLAASSAIYRGAPLDRHMRDILTACQHRMVHPRIYGPAGRLLLGRDSGDPLV